MYASRLLRLFLLCKSCSLLLAVICALYFHPYNKNTELFLTDKSGPPDLIRSVMAPFARWDATYFLRIASHGYEFENQHAFFPFYPMLMRLFAYIPKRLGVPDLTAHLLVGILISTFCHFLTIVNIYRLSLTLGADEYFAFLSASFATLSPAYPFQTAVYSESTFSFLTTSGMLAFYHRKRILASLMWCLAGLTRSNGVLLAGFFFYDLWRHLIRILIRDLIAITITISGFFGFQTYGYYSYCAVENPRPWCAYRIPDIYGFVQENYW